VGTIRRTRTRWGNAGAARSGPPGSLRHFYASGLIAAGCDVVNVQRTLGYANATTTLETYSHLWPSAEDRTRAAATSLTREVLSSGTGNLRAESQLGLSGTCPASLVPVGR
jgi:integrase